MPEQPGDVPALRGELDDLDRSIVELIARRGDVVAAIGREKQGGTGSLRDPGRESVVLEGVERVARELGANATLVRRIFRELIDDSLTRQATLLGAVAQGSVRVAYQGAAFSYSYLTASKWLTARGFQGELVGHRNFAAALTALTAGEVDLAVLPIENTTAGSITDVYALLRETEVSIVGEETWKVDHCLAALADTPLSAVTEVLSQPQALAQCQGFLTALPGAVEVAVPDTAEAMRMVASGERPGRAAIGSPEAAEAHGLVVLRHGVADQEENHTRFVVLARQPVEVDLRVPCKTSVVLVTRHEEGALTRCLDILAASGHSMTKLESRPLPGRPWEYQFFLDFEGNLSDPRTTAALDELRSAALVLKVLGSYPAKAVRAPAVVAQPGATAPTVPAPQPVSASPARNSSAYKLVSRDSRAADTLVRVGDLLIGGDGFVVMAGPCSVEDAAQVGAAARAVKDAGAHVLRGGTFKPRTSPYAFQGLGFDGVDLLVEAGRQAGMPVVTEVMAPEQVKPMAAKVDMLQVGARNMQNFDLLRELGRQDRPVLLKRGLSSTIDEWLAAAEYIAAQGNQQVVLCERGIRTFESATRNTLDLSAVPVLRERTHLPVVVDPSHGTGNRAYVAPMALAARAVGAHGLLIEVHPTPDQAWSDGDQSLDPAQFAELMGRLAGVPAPR